MVNFVFYFVLNSIMCFTAFAADTSQTDLPIYEISEQDSIRMIFQNEVAVLRKDSLYDFLVTTQLWPCGGVVISHDTNHIMLHKDSGTDVKSLQALFPLIGITENTIATVKVVIFSRKMRPEIYKQRGFFEEYRGLSQEQELERAKKLLTELNIPADNIKIFLSSGMENTLIVNKKGEIFRASPHNKMFYAIKDVEKISRTALVTANDAVKIQEEGNYITNATRARVLEAFSDEIKANNGRFNINDLRKPYMKASEAPKDWPCYTSNVCMVSNCHRLSKNHCGACKQVSYCSKECQIADWPKHKLNCKKQQ